MEKKMEWILLAVNRVNNYSTLCLRKIIADTFGSNKMDVEEGDFELDKIEANEWDVEWKVRTAESSQSSVNIFIVHCILIWITIRCSASNENSTNNTVNCKFGLIILFLRVCAFSVFYFMSWFFYQFFLLLLKLFATLPIVNVCIFIINATQ